MSSAERHRRAVEQSLGWAQAAADSGDFREAVAWTGIVLAVDGELPPGWAEKHQEWRQRADPDTRKRPPWVSTQSPSPTHTADGERGVRGTAFPLRRWPAVVVRLGRVILHEMTPPSRHLDGTRRAARLVIPSIEGEDPGPGRPT